MPVEGPTARQHSTEAAREGAATADSLEGTSGATDTTAADTSIATAGADAGISALTGYPLVGVNQRRQFTTWVADSARKYRLAEPKWESSYTPFATVDQTGMVTGKWPGTTNIRAFVGKFSQTITITVANVTTPPPSNPAVASVVVTLPASTTTVGASVQASASTLDASGKPVTGGTTTWTSSNNGIATVSATGVVTAVAQGTVSITATNSGKSGAATLTVQPASTTAPASVSVTINAASLTVGQTTTAAATVKDASGKTIAGATVAWSSSNATIAAVNAAGVVTAAAAGQANIVATSGGKSGAVTVTVAAGSGGGTTPPTTGGGGPSSSTNANPPALPQATVNTAYVPPSGQTIRVPSGGNLQAAIDGAKRGDVILLAAGGTYTGSYALRNKAGSGWITIRTDAPDASLPPQGSRITPAYSGALPKLVSQGRNQPVFFTDAGASFYRIMGVEITSVPTSAVLTQLVQFGESAPQKTLASVPSNLILDRVWIHGVAGLNLQRCVALNSAASAVVDSYLSECAATGFDSQAIAGWNGPGPFKIVNNYLEGAGENVMFGGADPMISGLVPSDIEIRGNHFFKKPSWKGSRTVKNLFELKNSRRVLVENNIFENNWADAQQGFAILLKSTNQAGACTWCTTSDVTFRYNIVRNSPAGLTILGVEYYSAVPAARFRIEQNLWENIGTYNGTTNGRIFMFLAGPSDIYLANNTALHSAGTPTASALIVFDAMPATQRWVFRDNIGTQGGIYGAILGSGAMGLQAILNYVTGWGMDRNVIAGVAASLISKNPSNNYYPTSVSNIGFASAGVDYRLSTSSPYRGLATNGGDPGVDFGALKARTSPAIVP
jgi:Big-like domain-containing protein